jgi:hypothetical protein
VQLSDQHKRAHQGTAGKFIGFGVLDSLYQRLQVTVECPGHDTKACLVDGVAQKVVEGPAWLA